MYGLSLSQYYFKTDGGLQLAANCNEAKEKKKQNGRENEQNPLLPTHIKKLPPAHKKIIFPV